MNPNAILESDTPEVRLRKILSTGEYYLFASGLDDSVIEKGKLLCPDLIENAHKLQSKIDSQFLALREQLQKKEIWDEFVDTKILPYLIAWAVVILEVKGKFNKAGDSQ